MTVTCYNHVCYEPYPALKRCFLFHQNEKEQKILGVERFISNYQLHSVTEPLKKAMKKGTNTIAVHTRQTAGGQYIDLAILVEN